MTEVSHPDTPISSWRDVAHLPVALFGGVMGLTGLSVCWSLAHARYGAPAAIGQWIGVVAILAFVAVSAGYVAKVVIAPSGVRDEFRHPVTGPLFGTVPISLMLLPILVAPTVLVLAQVIWAAGAIVMLFFASLTVSRWMAGGQEASTVSATWIVPIVGLLDLPLAVPSLNLPQVHGVMVLALSVGLFFAVPLFTIIFSRLLFGQPLTAGLEPTLLILLAPFAVGFSAYVATVDQVDLLAQSLYMIMMFFLVLLIERLRHLPACCPFRMSWWAVSFPLAASATAALRFSQIKPGWITDGIALLLLGLATAVIAGLLVRTLIGITRGELKTLSGAKLSP